MKSKMIVSVSILALLVVSVLALWGCAQAAIGYYYFYPDWTPDGNIVCVKNEHRSSGGGGGFWSPAPSSEDKYYIATMDTNGENETEIKQINQVGIVAASPLGNYYAYAEGNVIKVIDTAGTEISSINCGATVISFDWSPDDTKIVYLIKETDYVAYVVNIDGTNSQQIATNLALKNIAWRYGNKILCFGDIGDDWGLTVLDGTNYLSLLNNTEAKGDEINVSNINTSEAIYRGSAIDQVNIGSGSATPETIIERNDLWNVRLSPSGEQLVATGDNTDGKEIWIINIDGTGLKQLKD